MRSPATVSVYNNFATSEPSVGIRATSPPSASGVNNNLCVHQHVRRYHLLDHLLCKHLLHHLQRCIGVVLSGDQDVVNSKRGQSSVLLFNVLQNHLAFAVGAQPCNFATVALFAHLLANFVCQPVRVRVQVFLVPFISSISKHQPLVPCTEVVLVLVFVNCSSNLGRLGLDVQNNVHVKAVKPNILARKANLLAHIASHLLEVYLLLCYASDFAE